jgi:hypothetical protein
MKVGHFYFSSAQEPSEGMSITGSPEKFCSSYVPTFSTYTVGIWYANITDIPIENILPFAFPFGIGGP